MSELRHRGAAATADSKATAEPAKQGASKPASGRSDWRGGCRSCLLLTFLGVSTSCVLALMGAWRHSDGTLKALVRDGQELQAQQPGGERKTEDRSLFLLWCEGGSKKLGKAEATEALLLGTFIETALPLAESLAVYVDDPENIHKPSSPNIMPIAAPFCGMVYADLKSDGERAFTEALTGLGFKVAAYRVDGHVYTDYGEYAGPAVDGWDPKRMRNWNLGKRSPYYPQVTCFPRPSRHSSHDDWVKLYWETQSPMSEMIQPRAKYVRTVMREALSPDAPAYGACTIEVWPTPAHTSDYFRFFNAGDPWELLVNVCVMVRSVMGFTDIWRVQQATMGEYLLK